MTGAGTTIVRCLNCGLVFPDPQPIPARIEDHYNMPGETYWGDARARPEVQPAALTHWQKLRTQIGGEVAPCALDVGVGSGFTAQAMIAAGFDVHGFEPIPQFRELALEALALPAGRIAACEIMRMTGRVRDMIMDHTQTGRLPEVIADGGYYGMQTFDQALFHHLKAGLISMEQAIAMAGSPHDFKLLVAADGKRGTTMADLEDAESRRAA